MKPFLLLLSLSLLLSACDSMIKPVFTQITHPPPSEDKLQIVTTATFITDIVQQIAGDRADVHGLMGPAVDPHLYKPTSNDIAKLNRADLIFYNGLHLEGRMTDLFVRLAREGRKVHALADALPEEQLLEPAEFEGHYDPHVWFDPPLYANGIDLIVKALSEADPSHTLEYKIRADQYKDSLLEVHQWAIERAKELPESSRVIITSHDAFNYFGRTYGFEVIGVQGISTVTEAGVASITQMVDFIKKRNVKAIFVESSVSQDNIRRISEDSGAKVGGELFSDASGQPGKLVIGPNGKSYDESTYLGMLVHNINTTVDALK